METRVAVLGIIVENTESTEFTVPYTGANLTITTSF